MLALNFLYGKERAVTSTAASWVSAAMDHRSEKSREEPDMASLSTLKVQSQSLVKSELEVWEQSCRDQKGLENK